MEFKDFIFIKNILFKKGDLYLISVSILLLIKKKMIFINRKIIKKK